MLSQVVELIETKHTFGITTHIKPDGDGVGSSLGLCWLLRSLGKEAEVVVCDEVPPAYRSLPGADEILDVSSVNGKYDAIFVIECSDVDRPGIDGLDKQFTVNIDHHATREHLHGGEGGQVAHRKGRPQRRRPDPVPSASRDFPTRSNPESRSGVFRGTIDPWPLRIRT